ncbi:glucoamylase family protein [Arachidicoccus soli]|nr:glucoamylase family protein [Arachidicoccus soli]
MTQNKEISFHFSWKIILNLFFIFFFVQSTEAQNKPLIYLSFQNEVNDSAFLTMVQKQTFNYFYEGAEPHSGMARERINMDGIYPQNDKNVVTTGGSGFGIMTLLVGEKRGFISKRQLYLRLRRIVYFLEKANTYHGAFSHWYNGKTGQTKPFGTKDNGGDLVETSFLFQGLLCARQYLSAGGKREKALANRINKLWENVDYQWYTHQKNVIYWHWSLKYQWQMDFPIHGFNECLIAYILGACSPTHSIDKVVYDEGWAMNGKIKRNSNYDGIPLQFFHQGDLPNGGPLFWSQYSFLGLNPFGLRDQYGDYGQECVNMAKINYQWCVDNPKHFVGYGKNSWGLTASYSVDGYAGHAPNLKSDLGVISPTAALSSFPYTPKESLSALKCFYYKLGNKIWGKYGFYDSYSETANWYPQKYLAIDQGPIAVMIENYRTRYLWQLFMSCPEVKKGLMKLGFSYKIPED